MKKTISLLAALALILCLAPPAMAADDVRVVKVGEDDVRVVIVGENDRHVVRAAYDTPQVRVNGYLVEFPDQGPVIDANNRTLVPVRFATEALEADVKWDNAAKTATISKGGVSVKITIGKQDLTVTRDGKTSSVAMDTQAVLLNGRTMVPIRFVAEALGAYVDYSAKYRVIGIYQDELTPEQIRALQELPMTFNSSNYHNSQALFNSEPFRDEPAELMDSVKKNTGSWADMREDLYAQMAVFRDTGRENRAGRRYYNSLEKTIADGSNAEAFAHTIEDAKAALEYHSDNLDVEFITDPSCIYQELAVGDAGDTLFTNVRGYAKVDIKNSDAFTRYENYLTDLLGMNYIGEGPQFFPIDAHMFTGASVQLQETWNFEVGLMGRAGRLL